MLTIVITAMKDELESIIDIASKNEFGDYQIDNVIFTISGIGKVNASHAATKIINKYGRENILKIINVGSAGSFTKTIGTIVKGTKFVYGDVDVRAFDYKFGQIPQMPDYYGNDIGELVVTCDSFVTDTTQIKEHFPNASAIEMEACAIAQVCHHEEVEFRAFKIITDNADQNASVDFKLNLSEKMKHCFDTILKGEF
jgi:adenosylhomocysteine nucleosidase